MNIQHPLYDIVQDKGEASAWSFITPDKIEKIHFNFYPIRTDEVRAKVLYCGLCHSDTLMSKGLWFKDLIYPIVCGHEVIGEIEQVGTEVSNFKKGDKVGFGFQRDCCEKCEFCLNDKETLCSEVKDKTIFGKYFGGFATYIQQPARFCFKIPDKLDLKRAPSLLCAGVTVYGPIRYYAKPGDRTAVLGIGGLGHMAVEFLSKLGYHVTAFNNVKEYNELIKSLGADVVVDIENDEEVAKYENKFDFIINTLPVGEGFERLLNIAAPRCRFIQVGLPARTDYLKVPAIPLVFKEISIIGSIVGNRRDMNEMLSLCAEKDIYPICETFKFDDFEKAVYKIEKGHPKLRIVLDLTSNQ